jgi:hypothetical protein
MCRSPALHPLEVLGAAEVVAVLRLLQPSLLAVGFAGFTARWFSAVALPSKVARIRQEQLPAMTTFFSCDCDHRPAPPHKVDVSGSLNGNGKNSLEKNAEENKKMRF